VYPIYTLTNNQSLATKFEFYNNTAAGNPRFSAFALDDHQETALMGPGPAGELLYMVNAGYPTANSIPGGMLMEWATFVTPNNNLGVDDGSANKRRTFVVVEGDGGNNTIALWDGELQAGEEGGRPAVLTRCCVGISRTWDDINPITLGLVPACKWKVDCPESARPPRQ
jgi:hypothetical protein